MIYKSKKDPEITAAFDFEDEKCATTRLIYLTGEKKGKSFVVSNSTLKRWWTPVEDKKENDNPLNLDFEQINKPYKPDVTPHYIPKPQSVIEYEEKKSPKKRVASFTMPTDYEQFADILAERNVAIKKVNSGYISLMDNSKLKLLKTGIGVLASNDVAERIVKKGIQARPCIEKGTPFRFDINSAEEYEWLLEALSE